MRKLEFLLLLGVLKEREFVAVVGIVGEVGGGFSVFTETIGEVTGESEWKGRRV